jgi:glucose-6-phosphate 1-dehydrogenase
MKHTTIIIFGITGDLARRQLLPALYYLIAADVSSSYEIIGVAQQVKDVAALWAAAKPFMGSYDETKLKIVQDNTHLIAGDITEAQTYRTVHELLKAIEKRHGQSNHLIYCATPSFLYDAITKGCADEGILKKQPKHGAPWQRIVYEKPFGYNRASAQKLNTEIAHYLDEHQIFRIDHYLTKEVVSSIALIRFTNIVFEPLWNNRYIDQVHIIAAESIGIEGRGAYYDAYGALRDMVQNHLLQLTALIGMESPTKLSGDAIRDARLTVLQNLSCDDGLFGQYRGYLQEPQVKSDSSTETYALLKCAINSPRWHGVPFYLMTGKKLAHKETVIYIKFKTVDCLLAKQCPSPANWLTIRVAPEGIFSLTLNGKDPAAADKTVPIEMAFCPSGQFTFRATQAYEQALSEVLRGEQSASVRFDEIDASWQFIDTVLQKKFPLYQYEPGSEGPSEVAAFAKKHGVARRAMGDVARRS